MKSQREFIHLVVQTFYVEGGPYGCGSICNAIKRDDLATLFVTGAHPTERSHNEIEWKTEIRDIEVETFDALAEALVAQSSPVISNRSDDDHPLDYLVEYVITGNPKGQAVNLTIEWVLKTKGDAVQQKHPLLELIQSILDSGDGE